MKKTQSENIEEAVRKRLSELLGFIDERHIVSCNPKTGVIFIGSERIDEGRAQNLKSESEFMLKSDLWKVLNETIRHQAYETMFTKSTSFEDMKSGKMMLYLLDVQKKVMNIFSSYRGKT